MDYKIIGQTVPVVEMRLNNGETVQVIDSSDPSYWYVHSSSLMKYRYVNKDYLY